MHQLFLLQKKAPVPCFSFSTVICRFSPTVFVPYLPGCFGCEVPLSPWFIQSAATRTYLSFLWGYKTTRPYFQGKELEMIGSQTLQSCPTCFVHSWLGDPGCALFPGEVERAGPLGGMASTDGTPHHHRPPPTKSTSAHWFTALFPHRVFPGGFFGSKILTTR